MKKCSYEKSLESLPFTGLLPHPEQLIHHLDRTQIPTHRAGPRPARGSPGYVLHTLRAGTARSDIPAYPAKR